MKKIALSILTALLAAAPPPPSRGPAPSPRAAPRRPPARALCPAGPPAPPAPEGERPPFPRLHRHAAGRTLLFVTHHPALAAECDATLRL